MNGIKLYKSVRIDGKWTMKKFGVMMPDGSIWTVNMGVETPWVNAEFAKMRQRSDDIPLATEIDGPPSDSSLPPTR